MSGIYIPGMEMPTHCIDCPFMVSRDGDDCILQSDEANSSFENWEQMKAGCPLVPVPPHGRLIDAGALTYLMGMDEHFSPLEAMYLMELIADAPTIIPAEEGE